MKKIADISAITWIVGFIVAVGIGWMAYGMIGEDPTAESEKCLEAAKVLVTSERDTRFRHMAIAMSKSNRSNGNLEELKKSKEAEKAPKRAYEKALARVKEKESILHTHSKAIDKWVTEGRAMFKLIPMTETELKRANGAKLDEDWEIYMEQDMIDLLNKS